MFSNWIFLRSLTPRAPKVWLQLSAGLVWFGVGMMLAGFSLRWLKVVAFPVAVFLTVCGLALATAIHLFGFSRLARRNICRIAAFEEERVCLFAFQEWRNYPLVAFMVALGIYLRLYSPFPKSMLAILYLGIGGGLFLSSLHYFGHVVQTLHSSAIERLL